MSRAEGTIQAVAPKRRVLWLRGVVATMGRYIPHNLAARVIFSTVLTLLLLRNTHTTNRPHPAVLQYIMWCSSIRNVVLTSVSHVWTK